MSFQSVNDNEKRAIVYCRSEARADLQRQEEKILSYAKAQGYTVTETFIESGSCTDSLTYRSLRLRAKYREFDALLIMDVKTLGNSAIEITQEIDFLNQNGVKIISLQNGELNAKTLPDAFRKNFRLIK